MLNGYETATKMKGKLTPEQRKRLDAMNPAGLWNVWDGMMSHMTVNQMARMMRYMYSPAGVDMMGCSGTIGNMMGNGMMGGW